MSKSALGMTKKWVLALFLLVCFAAAAGIRVYDLTDLPLDFHPARQLQSMLKARGMYAATGDATQFSAEQIDIALKQWRGQPTQEPEVMIITSFRSDMAAVAERRSLSISSLIAESLAI